LKPRNLWERTRVEGKMDSLLKKRERKRKRFIYPQDNPAEGKIPGRKKTVLSRGKKTAWSFFFF